jgi:hypothetical protein
MRALIAASLARLYRITKRFPRAEEVAMGREGFEPSTLGLRVDAILSVALGRAAQCAWLSQTTSDLMESSGAAC